VNTAAELFGPIFAGLIGASTRKGRGLGKDTIRLRECILDVIASGDGGSWTVRQIFYATSVAGGVEKSEAGYRQVQRQVLAMRREGLINYSTVADNTRWVRQVDTYSSLEDWVDESLRALRLDLWRDAEQRIEVWLEKDALAGVVSEITNKWRVPLYVTRGYASESFAFEAAENANADARPFRIVYLGDFDASGVHMARDLEQRLRGFLDDADRLTFDRIAVTPQQIVDLGLPSRPNKETDTRYAAFAAEFPGLDATELDAIRPDTLRELVENEITNAIDDDLLGRILQEEREARELAKQITAQFRGRA
jgi:hypothetical protein